MASPAAPLEQILLRIRDLVYGRTDVWTQVCLLRMWDHGVCALYCDTFECCALNRRRWSRS